MTNYNEIMEAALKNGHYEVLINTLNVKSIEVGRGIGEACEEDNEIELWLHFNKPAEQFLSEQIANTIIDNDDIGEDARNEWYCENKDKGGCYDYHLSYFPRAWFADMYPDLIKSDSNPAKKEESLMEFALNHGCDYLDMSTMTIYHP